MDSVTQAWDSKELEAIVRAYGTMLQSEIAGRAYVKAELNRTVQAATGRSRSSVEFKFCNISAVLRDAGYRWVRGYAPRSNYQQTLAEVTLQILSRDFPEALRADLAFDRELHVSVTEPWRRGDGGAAPGPTDALTLSALWERATGGSAVAVSPIHHGSTAWPLGPGSPGSDEVVRALLDALNAPPDKTLDLVFLVGGPGNGKSELSRWLATQLAPESSGQDGLAHRSYAYQSSTGRRLRLVNDATIPPKGSGSPDRALLEDIRQSIAEERSLLANVNRGLLEEQIEADGLAADVWRWLQETSAGLTSRTDVRTVESRRFELDGQMITVWVVLMDVCSLLERRPVTTIDSEAGAASQTPYKLMELASRDLSGGDVPAAELLKDFAERLADEGLDLPEWHPVRTNVEALQVEAFRENLLLVLRASELAASRHFTYRELWGAFVRCVLGNLPEEAGPGDALRWLASQEPTNLTGLARFEALARLANLRTHQAIVGAPSFRAQRAPRLNSRHPVLRLTSVVDPALDATPDWSRPVHEAMAFRDSTGPLATLIEMEGSLLGVSAFDLDLDRAYSSVADELTDAERRSVDSWYGAYLIRLFALSKGRPGFLEELNLWTKAWLATGNHWPDSLKLPLRTLLFPIAAGQQSMILPVLEARARPLTGHPETPKLVRSIDSTGMGIKKERKGEALFVTITMEEGGTAELELDFSLLREALACRDGHLGLSERAQSTLPRLERFRANLLRPENDFGYSVVIHDERTAVDLTR